VLRDYRAWHNDYDVPGSAIAQRLRVVQQRLNERLTAAPPGRLQLISMCAGQGRDVIPVLASHSRREDVHAVLLEIDAHNVDAAMQAAAQARVTDLEVVKTDASASDAYTPHVPGDIVLACGIFGNVSDADIEGTVRNLSMLCKPNASVIWTRHRREPDLTPSIRRWFAESGFEELGFDALDNQARTSVGVARLTGAPIPFKPGVRLFTFIR
jgi:hypothetical protein